MSNITAVLIVIRGIYNICRSRRRKSKKSRLISEFQVFYCRRYQHNMADIYLFQFRLLGMKRLCNNEY